MKKGFTLAEVLVTLGIIGVVAALTTPALIQSVGNSKVAPRLQKVKSTFETAVEMMLTEQNANSISAVCDTSEDIGKNLSSYMKMTRVKHTDAGKYDYKQYSGDNVYVANDAVEETLGLRYNMDDGTVLFIKRAEDKIVPAESYSNTPNNQKIGDVYVDINGNEGPNRVAKDLFRFIMYNDGTLRPYGGRNADRAVKAEDDKMTWETYCSEDGFGETAEDSNGEEAFTCTGSIFDNGMKIIYQ